LNEEPNSRIIWNRRALLGSLSRLYERSHQLIAAGVCDSLRDVCRFLLGGFEPFLLDATRTLFVRHDLRDLPTLRRTVQILDKALPPEEGVPQMGTGLSEAAGV
jgi:hypothetical protein